MDKPLKHRIRVRRGPVRPGAGERFFLLLLLASALILLSACRSRGVFRPGADAATPGADFDGFPATVTLPQLAANPMNFLNRPVRVSGEFTVVEPSACKGQLRGPAILWSIAADDWQLNVAGMEELPTRLPQGTLLTLDGLFQQYVGPVGCGKGPEAASVWYLRVLRVVEPNPLPLVNGLDLPGVGVALGLPEQTVTPATIEGTAAQPGAQATNSDTGATPASTPTASFTPTPTIASPLASPPVPGATITATSTATPSATPTATPEAAGPTPTPDPAATSTPALPPPTATSGGYPPLPTSTPHVYP